MKSIKIFTGILVLMLVFGIMLTGCETEPDEPTYKEPTYTVWTDTVSYSEFYNVFGNLNDGYYRRIELTNSEFNSMSQTNEGKKVWTEDQIKKWFIGRDFTTNEANQNTAWLLTIDHGIIFNRRGSIVDILMK